MTDTADTDRSTRRADGVRNARASDAGIVATLRALAKLHSAPLRPLLSIFVAGGLAGFLEAGALVAFMAAALRLLADSESDVGLGAIHLDGDPSSLLAIAAIAIVLAAGLHALIARVIADGSLTVVRRARRRMLAGYLRAPWTTQASLPDGLVHDTVFQLAQGASTAAVFVLSAINGAIILVTLIVSAFIVAPAITGLLAVTLVPIIVVLQPMARMARRRAADSVESAVAMSEEVAATTNLSLELQAFGVQERQLDDLIALNDQTVDEARRARFSTRLAAFWFKDLALLVLVIVVATISLLSSLEDPAASAAIIVVIRALGYAQQTYNAYGHVTELSPSVIELQRRIAALDHETVEPGSRPLTSIGSIAFERVGYRYPNGTLALDDVSFEIPAGKVIGLVGRSGAGKSTLAELLLRLRTPTAGQLTVDGADVAEVRLSDWRELVAFVPQDTRVWRRSVADNISFLRPRFSRSDVVAAARSAQLHDDIVDLPDGYDTVLGAQNRGLSGGQRQRLAIARALIADPALMVLDEPTSALDSESERRLRHTLMNLRGAVSMLVIAHRISTLDICDEIVVLDRGRVVASGPRGDLTAVERYFDPPDEPAT